MATVSSRSWLSKLLAFVHARPLPLGPRGERYAARYLQKQGIKIIARNRMLGGSLKGEIDLIGIEKEFLVFIEVRTRASEDFMTPEQSIRHDKKKALLRSVRRLIRKHKTAGLIPRIDVVAIIWPDGAKHPAIVRHHRGVLSIQRW